MGAAPPDDVLASFACGRRPDGLHHDRGRTAARPRPDDCAGAHMPLDSSVAAFVPLHHLLPSAPMPNLQGLALLAALLLPGVLQAQQPRWLVEIEGGPAWQSYNDVEIPNDGSATRFSLYDLAGSGPWPTGRLQVTWNPWDNHGFRVLLAPFSLSETGQPEQDVQFAGGTFLAAVPTRAT